MADLLTRAAIEQRQQWASRNARNPMEDSMDLLRLLEYPQLLGKTYLDHAGTTPWAKSLVTGYSQLMTDELYGNPHSESTPSKLSTARIDAAREKALRFFKADPEHFDLVFVANATAAIKLVHDCFRDHAADARRNWWYGYHRDAHTSVVGVREGTRMNRCFKNDHEVNMWIESKGLGGAGKHDISLFAYPGQSNMTGRRLPLDWPAQIRRSVKGEVYTLLDAAALASTTQIDLSRPEVAPDFMTVSFYKIFGFPNLGALIVRKSPPVTKILQSRNFFGGGTVEMVISINHNWSSKKQEIHDRLEDGTLPFTSIFALGLAIDTHRKLYGPAPMEYISIHTCRLIKKLYDQLNDLKHANGAPVVKIYKDQSTTYGESHLQGATIAFNVQRPEGGLVSFMEVEKEADKRNIYLRSGSLCNPGGLATHLEWSPQELLDAYAEGHRCSEPLAEVFGKAIGVVRVSLGAMSNDDDCTRFVEFLRETYVNTPITITPPDSVIGNEDTPKQDRSDTLRPSEDTREPPKTSMTADHYVSRANGLLSPPPENAEYRTPSRDGAMSVMRASSKDSRKRFRRFRMSLHGAFKG